MVIYLSRDGTGQFASSNISCKDCCRKNLRNGEKQYYHQERRAVITHPDKSNVLPGWTEAITRQDGENKNDCERKKVKRLLPAIQGLVKVRYKLLIYEWYTEIIKKKYLKNSHL